MWPGRFTDSLTARSRQTFAGRLCVGGDPSSRVPGSRGPGRRDTRPAWPHLVVSECPRFYGLAPGKPLLLPPTDAPERRTSLACYLFYHLIVEVGADNLPLYLMAF